MKVILSILLICVFGLSCRICVGPTDLEVTAKGTYYIDFMPIIPADGRHLSATITVTVTNLSFVDAMEFVTTKAILYYAGTTDVFDMVELSGSLETISAGETMRFEYIGKSSKTYTPETFDADSLYAKVHVKWCGGKKVITTPTEEVTILW